MAEQNQEMTAEQYKVEVLKQNFARRIAEYEDVIATLQTQLQMAKQQLEQVATENDVEVPELPAEDDAPAPPPPPQVETPRA